jgi:Pentapeptide repeats (8 copies)
MANEQQLAILRHGPGAWNVYRQVHPDSRVDLRQADLRQAVLEETNLRGADLTGANLAAARLAGSDLSGANLTLARLTGADLRLASLSGGDLDAADLVGANLEGADMRGANLQGVLLVGANLARADLSGCRVYGVSAWDLYLEDAQQNDLIITRTDQPEVTADHLEVAQFIYLLLHNEKIRDVIDTVGKKGVLLLGRFAGDRLAVLERLRDELRKRGFLPMVFNFDKPETKDFTETIRLLAGISRFVIVDITNPRSAPLELQATVPENMIPFVPILERGEEPFAMFRDLWTKHRQWVLDLIRYSTVDRLVEVLDTEIIEPAQARFAELLAMKAEGLRIKDI